MLPFASPYETAGLIVACFLDVGELEESLLHPRRLRRPEDPVAALVSLDRLTTAQPFPQLLGGQLLLYPGHLDADSAAAVFGINSVIGETSERHGQRDQIVGVDAAFTVLVAAQTELQNVPLQVFELLGQLV